MIKLLTNQTFEQTLINEINNARKEILIETFKIEIPRKAKSKGTGRLLQALFNAKKRKVEIKIILCCAPSLRSIKKENERTAALLNKHGITPYTPKSGQVVHGKTIIIDETIIVLGSHNLAENSLHKNIEASIIADNGSLIDRAREEFYKVYMASIPIRT